MRIETNRAWTVAELQAALAGADDAAVVVFGKTLKRDQTSECWCGCGGETKGRFVPGHDSRFHSLAKQVARGQAEMPTEFVNEDAEADFMMWHDREVPIWEAKVALGKAKKAAKATAKAPVAEIKSMEPVGALDPESDEYKALLAEVSLG